MGTTYNFASVNNGAFASTSGGGHSSVSATFAEFNSGNVFGDIFGNIYQAYYSGGAAFTAAATPIGSSAITAIGRAPYGYGSYYYIANAIGSLATRDSIGPTWTLINSPITANSGDYIIDIHYKSDGLFKNVVLLITAQGRMFVGPSNAADYTPWTEISPAALGDPLDGVPVRYRFMNRFGASINTQLGTRAGAATPASLSSTANFITAFSRGITYTDNY
jgi:hypothetical protein